MSRITFWAVFFAGLNFFALNLLHILVLKPMAGGRDGPDLQWKGYTPSNLQAWKSALQDSGGVDAFLRLHTFGFDLLFPFLLSAALILLLRGELMKFPRFARQGKALQWLVPAALVLPYLLFDLIENATVREVLLLEEPVSDALATTASSYTILKFVFVALAFAALFVFRLASLKYRKRGV